MEKMNNNIDLFERFITINKEEALDENISLKVISLDYEDLFNYFKGGKYTFDEKELIIEFIEFLSYNNYKVYNCKELNKIYINIMEIEYDIFSSIVEKCIKKDNETKEKYKKKKNMNIVISILSIVFFVLLFTVLF